MSANQKKTAVPRLISAVNRRLVGSKLQKRRDTGRLTGFTASGVREFVSKNKQSVTSAERLGDSGFDRLAARFIREHTPKSKKK